jgi:O-methyltransferase
VRLAGFSTADTARHWTLERLVVPLETVKHNFRRYGLLDRQVRFLHGWFHHTFPKAPIDRLAILRLDGALYELTIDTLRWLYHKVSLGGYVIIDDYGAVRACRQAVHDLRSTHGIAAPMHQIDWTGVFWEIGRRDGMSKRAN